MSFQRRGHRLLRGRTGGPASGMCTGRVSTAVERIRRCSGKPGRPSTGSLSAFWGPAGAWLGVAALVGYLGNSLATCTAERFVLRLRAAVFRHVQDLPPHFFQRHRPGDLVERLTGDVECI
jgi:hypothetical protein